MIATATKPTGRPPTHPRLSRVRVLLCSCKCKECKGGHKYTEPLDAERIDRRRVRITQRDDQWFGAILTTADFVWCD